MAKLGISTGTIPNDGTGDTLLDGAIKINNNFNEIYNHFGDGTNLTAIGGTWAVTSAGIHTLSNVGIGTTNPTEELTVFGDARVTGILTVGTASITLNGTTNTINVGSGVTIDGNSGIISATSIVLGGSPITGSGVTSITAGSGISVDQSTGNVTISATGGSGGESYWSQTTAGINTLSNVGIGTTNPTDTLTVRGTVSIASTAHELTDLTIDQQSSLTIRNTTGYTIIGKQVINGGNINAFNTAYGKDLEIAANGSDDGSRGDIIFYRKQSLASKAEIARLTSDRGNLILGKVAELQSIGWGGNFTAYGNASIAGVTTTTNLNVTGVSTFGSSNKITISDSGYGRIAYVDNSARTSEIEFVTGNVYVYPGNLPNNHFNVIGSGFEVYPSTGITTTNRLFSKSLNVSGIATISGDGTNAYLRYGSSNAYTNFVTTYNVSQIGGVPLIFVDASGAALSADTTLNAAYWRVRTKSTGAEVNGTLEVTDLVSSGIVTASSFSGSNTLKERTVISGITTEIANNGIGNTNITGFKSYALMKVGLSTAGWLRLYTDSASRSSDVSRSVGEDPAPGSGVIAEVVTTGISTTQIISPFVMGGNLNNPADTTIYAAITNLSGSTQTITANLTILQLEA